MKLKELKALIIINKRGGKLPSYKQLTQSGIPVVLQLNIDNAKLVVYQNGLVTYSKIIGGKMRHTVYSIDKLELHYEFNSKRCSAIKLSDYPEVEEYDAVDVLEMCGQDRLDYNTFNREGYHAPRTIKLNGDCYQKKDSTRKKLVPDYPDFTDAVIDRLNHTSVKNEYEVLRKAMEHLTAKQLVVVQLYYYDNLTQQQIADKLGISRRSVEDRIDGALKKLRKYFK